MYTAVVGVAIISTRSYSRPQSKNAHGGKTCTMLLVFAGVCQPLNGQTRVSMGKHEKNKKIK